VEPILQKTFSYEYISVLYTRKYPGI
jgi:hypothetical protein